MVNFFSHAWIAARRQNEAVFVLGTMLPDFAPMVGARLSAMAHPALCDGIRFHHETDRVFHGHAAFTEACLDGVRALEAEGVRRGPARGVAHVGIELLLDGWLARERGVPGSYRAALGALREDAAALALPRTAGPMDFSELGRRIEDAGLPETYTDPVFVAARVERALRGRARLALAPEELPAVTAWLEARTPWLAAEGGALVDAVADRLGAGPVS